MIRSNNPILSGGGDYGTSYYKQPWRRNRTFSTRKAAIIFPWICMDCGIVYHYVEQKDREFLKQEYEEVKQEFPHIFTPSESPNIIKDPQDWN